ncbi:MAG TPA: hypothetical protein VH437_02745 [Terriglobales bacterium]
MQSNAKRREAGYVLLTMLLFVALLGITALAILPTVAFQAKRDQEEEMIHRGVQYSRAVRRYYKKFGRYPTRLEDLENTNNMRFLRKRYKDPITGKDFKLLHVGEVQLNSNPGIAGATSVNSMSSLNQQLDQNAKPPDNSANSDDTKKADSNQNASGNKTQQPNQGIFGSNNLSGQVFGGGAILGVASISKDKSIREFNKKKHYDEWQFVYDPSTDRGGLLTMPNQQSLGGGFNQAGQMGQPGQTGFGGLQPGAQPGQPQQFGQAPVNQSQPPPPDQQ